MQTVTKAALFLHYIIFITFPVPLSLDPVAVEHSRMLVQLPISGSLLSWVNFLNTLLVLFYMCMLLPLYCYNIANQSGFTLIEFVVSLEM